MTDVFSDDAISKLKVGQTLTFNNNTGSDHYKIVKIKDGRIWSKQINLYKSNELVINDIPKPSKKSKWVDKVTINE